MVHCSRQLCARGAAVVSPRHLAAGPTRQGAISLCCNQTLLFHVLSPPFPVSLYTATQLLSYALPAAVAAVGINSQLPGLLTGISSIQSAATAVQGQAAAISSIQQLALLHMSQEAVLALLLPAACRLALGPRVTAAQGSAYWAVQTLGTCLLLFPLVDPGLSSLWQPAAEVGFRGLHTSTRCWFFSNARLAATICSSVTACRLCLVLYRPTRWCKPCSRQGPRGSTVLWPSTASQVGCWDRSGKR